MFMTNSFADHAHWETRPLRCIYERRCHYLNAGVNLLLFPSYLVLAADRTTGPYVLPASPWL